MSEETEDVLRKSLDAVDRQRSRLIWSVVVTTLFLMSAFFWIHAGRMGDVRTAIAASIVILAFWTSGLTLVVVVQIAVATKRILRAIELTAKPRT
jgi:magnesium-transporting ATPase (P-type)